MTLKKMAAVGLASVTIFVTVACGNGETDSAAAHTRDKAVEESRFHEKVIPTIEDEGLTTNLETADDVCHRIDQGEGEDRIIDALDPYDVEGTRNVIRVLALHMCDTPEAESFESPEFA
ncbi:hypothetical protein [Corynebacterium glyciniphilum]|uniref:hypothetical protein n=1 Tax=Corynebacterium glyciniphilum TaxID=1404244 RepID=UPI003DA0C436